ncbi:hypothetical protein TGS27_0666 [Geobacillus stearothermophilus]|nr:hypothetical protein GLN3_04240 [Geobacillus lituanicus]OAO86169.1 hypothetical protein TGS27_0666 [Geobacillus stearothermophilus]
MNLSDMDIFILKQGLAFDNCEFYSGLAAGGHRSLLRSGSSAPVSVFCTERRMRRCIELRDVKCRHVAYSSIPTNLIF